jgi:hypothetical protein
MINHRGNIALARASVLGHFNFPIDNPIGFSYHNDGAWQESRRIHTTHEFALTPYAHLLRNGLFQAPQLLTNNGI